MRPFDIASLLLLALITGALGAIGHAMAGMPSLWVTVPLSALYGVGFVMARHSRR